MNLTNRVSLIVAALALGGVLATSAEVQQPQPPSSQTAAAPQQPARPLSPAGTAQTQVGGEYVKEGQREQYRNGKWIEITYGRPIRRGRDVFGTGADYGKALLAGAPVWRAGANVSTRLITEAPLGIGDKTVPAGEYSLFIDLKSPTEWTLIVSSYGAKPSGRDQTPGTLWGSYNYTPEKDVARVPMKVQTIPMTVDQLTWGFTDVTSTGGNFVLWWDKVMASAPFTVAK